MTPLPDGILRRVSRQTWKGTLHGYRVQMIYDGGVAVEPRRLPSAR